VVNEDANTKLIRKLRAQVVALKEQVWGAGSGSVASWFQK
jgi:hypothetical protein